MTPEKTQEAVRRIVEAPHPRKIILFGSRARGDATGDSDLGLMVVTGPMSETERVKEMARLRDLLSPLRMQVDVPVAPESKQQRLIFRGLAQEKPLREADLLP